MLLKNKYWNFKELEFNNYKIAKFFVKYILSPYDKIRMMNDKVLDFKIYVSNTFGLSNVYKFKVLRLHTTQAMIDDIRAIKPFDVDILEKKILEELNDDISKEINQKLIELGFKNETSKGN